MTRISIARANNAAKSLKGKTAIVTGGTSGIGQGVAVRLASAGSSVYIVGRDSVRAEAVLLTMERLKDPSASQTFKFIKCDCFSLAAVADCCQSMSSSLSSVGGTIDYLVLCHGMATIQGFTKVEETGLDEKLTLHVWSRASFMLNLKSKMTKSEDSRVATVLSAGVHKFYEKAVEDKELKKTYSIKNAADIAGTYNDVMIDSMSKDCRGGEFSGIKFIHSAPGFVKTRWGTEMPFALRMVIRLLQNLGRSKEDCAEYIMSALTAPSYQSKTNAVRVDEYGQEICPPEGFGANHDQKREELWVSCPTMLLSPSCIFISFSPIMLTPPCSLRLQRITSKKSSRQKNLAPLKGGATGMLTSIFFIIIFKIVILFVNIYIPSILFLSHVQSLSPSSFPLLILSFLLSANNFSISSLLSLYFLLSMGPRDVISSAVYTLP